MDILKKLTNKNLKLNKKRTVGTIIGIILSTAMICAVATMVTSFRKTLITETIENDGYYHLQILDIDNNTFEKLKANKDFSGVKPFYNIGYAEAKNSDDTQEDEEPLFIEIESASKQNLKDFKYVAIEGRLPNNNSEIMLTTMAMNYLDLKIGDTVTWDVGQIATTTEDNVTSDEVKEDNSDSKQIDLGTKNYLTDKKSKTYKIVGTTSIAYSLMGFTTSEVSDNMDVYMTLAKPSSYKTSIAQVLGVSDWDKFYNGEEEAKYQYSLNTFLLHIEVFSFSDETLGMLLTIAGIVIFIIMVASIFCIRNSFAISTIEKMKMYGMLSSVGATKKQIRKSVIYEGLVLGGIGIPIGILSGLLGDFVLFKVVNSLLKDFINTSNGIMFSPSIIACVIAILLAFLTIFLSSLSSARKASKVSPIDNLRSSKEVMVKAKKLKTPKVIEKVFKTGGVLAYKNLKRSKKKYRTTVISLTVSIFVFISLSYFIGAGFDMTSDYYRSPDYNISIYRGIHPLSDEDVKVITSFKDVKHSYQIYFKESAYFISHDFENMNDADAINETCITDENDKEVCSRFIYLNVVILDNATFKSYAKKIGVNYDKVKDKAIIYDMYYKYDDSTKTTSLERTFKYKRGDTFIFKDENEDKEYKYEVGAIAKEQVYGNDNVGSPTIVLNKDYFKEEVTLNSIYLDSEDVDATADDIEKYDEQISYNNHEKQAKATRSMVLVISIFLYGFITLITLIGVTNIFNTITANMELRSKEFAMLKSIGMTKKEFNRMITLETLFYSSKSLIYGTVLGLIGCLLLRKAFNEDVIREFVPPYGAIIACVIFVFVIVYVIMKYSIRKINKQNTIETIRNENV